MFKASTEMKASSARIILPSQFFAQNQTARQMFCNWQHLHTLTAHHCTLWQRTTGACKSKRTMSGDSSSWSSASLNHGESKLCKVQLNRRDYMKLFCKAQLNSLTVVFCTHQGLCPWNQWPWVTSPTSPEPDERDSLHCNIKKTPICSNQGSSM